MTTSSPAATEAPKPGTGHEGQTFLVGEHVYLRAIETGDAEYGSWWRQQPFPVSPARQETIIKEDLPKGQLRTYMIIRKADDVPVGAIWVHYGDVGATVMPVVGPVFGEAGTPWLVEALTMAVPWLVDEQHRPIALVRLNSTQTEAIAALEGIGATVTARFREAENRHGQRVDRLIVEYLNQPWVQRIGNPNDVPLDRTGTGEARPVPTKVVLEGDPPQNAVLVGRRVYLRPFEEKDGEAIAAAAREETETFHDLGRRLYSPTGIGAWHEKLQKDDPPKWVRFAVCLRENDEVIGAVGIEGINRVHRFAESESEMFRKEYRGSGYGSEAKHLLLEYAFDHLNLHSLQSYVLFDNTRSAAALRKQGYRDAGRMNWTYARHGRYGSMAVFDILADEWRALPRE